MENKKTIYHFIIDKSGSMQGLEGKTIRGFNNQLETLQKLQQEYPEQSFVVSLSFFNHRVSQVLRFGKIQELNPLSRSMYQPSGSTALLDAIGSSIEDIRSTYGVEIDQNQASVVIMILTDGEENSSTLYTQQLISKQIKTLEETDKWTFTFLGAEIDAYTIGERLNIKRENTMSFMKQDFDKTMHQMGCAMVDYTASKDKGNILSELFRPKKKLNED